jgi:hypothetical protein
MIILIIWQQEFNVSLNLFFQSDWTSAFYSDAGNISDLVTIRPHKITKHRNPTILKD